MIAESPEVVEEEVGTPYKTRSTGYAILHLMFKACWPVYAISNRLFCNLDDLRLKLLEYDLKTIRTREEICSREGMTEKELDEQLGYAREISQQDFTSSVLTALAVVMMVVGCGLIVLNGAFKFFWVF